VTSGEIYSSDAVTLRQKRSAQRSYRRHKTAFKVFFDPCDSEPKSIKKTATVVQEYARRHQTTAEAILLAWLLKHPAKIQPVLGTTRPDRLRACAKTVSISLSRDEWYSLFAAARGAPMP
jgi:predicted oxidoreductase